MSDIQLNEMFDDWREMVKPLFLRMHEAGVKRVTISRDGSRCDASFELDGIACAKLKGGPPPEGFTTVEHFDAAASWDDRFEMLTWAATVGATVPEMRAYRRALHGDDLVGPDAKETEE